MPHWTTSRFEIDLSRPRVMAIVNATPDSFAGDGTAPSLASLCQRCDRAVEEGADLLDIGGESTRPGASPPSAEEELARVLPVLRHAVTLGVPVSVDTSEPGVIRAALDLGVDVVNDVRALRRPGALALVAGHRSVGVCLMHMRGEPGTMNAEAVYADVVAEVMGYLRQRIEAVAAAGVAPERIVVDPGIGFAKTAGDNLQIARRQRELLALGRPLLVGWSRKGTLGRITGRAVGERQAASVAAALAAIEGGAAIVRVHDVALTVDAIKVWHALRPATTGCSGENLG